MKAVEHPVAGVDYPSTFQALDEWFRDEVACRAYIRRLRWPTGFCCPDCGVVGEPWAMAGGWLRCRACRRETSVPAGTIFEGTRKPLPTWFLAMWCVTSQTNGMSALGLQRARGLGSYATSWTWLHKLRRAMVRPGRDHLAGEIEADETYVGGPEEGKRGREVESKAIVAVAAEQRGRGIGRIRLRRVKDVSAESLLAFLEGGSRGDNSHRRAPACPPSRCRRRSRVPTAGPSRAAVRRVPVAVVRGAPARSQARGLLFHRLVQQAVAIGPAPYHSIITPRISANLPELGE